MTDFNAVSAAREWHGNQGREIVTHWEYPTQDDYDVTVSKFTGVGQRRDAEYRVSCSCKKLKVKLLRSESEATNYAMDHVLAHDEAYEEAEAE